MSSGYGDRVGLEFRKSLLTRSASQYVHHILETHPYTVNADVFKDVTNNIICDIFYSEISFIVGST